MRSLVCIFACLDEAGGDGSLNAALVGATEDLEVASVSPGVVPAVLDLPVLGAVLLAVADDLDGVSAEGLAGGVLVDAGGVGGEVLVDGEGGSDGAVGGDLLHHVLLGADGVRGLGLDLVVSVGGLEVTVDALLGALGGRVLVGGAVGVLVRVNVMGAGLEGVGVAGGSLLGVVIAAGGDAGRGEPLPGGGGLAAVAAHGHAAAEAGAAREGVLSGVPLEVMCEASECVRNYSSIEGLVKEEGLVKF